MTEASGSSDVDKRAAFDTKTLAVEKLRCMDISNSSSSLGSGGP